MRFLWIFVLFACESEPDALAGQTPSGVSRSSRIGQLSEDDRFLLCGDTRALWDPLIDPLRTCPAVASWMSEAPDTCLMIQAQCFENESVGSRRLDCFTLFVDPEEVRVGDWMDCFEGFHDIVAPRLQTSCQEPLGIREGLTHSPSSTLNTILHDGLETAACERIFGPLPQGANF